MRAGVPNQRVQKGFTHRGLGQLELLTQAETGFLSHVSGIFRMAAAFRLGLLEKMFKMDKRSCKTLCQFSLLLCQVRTHYCLKTTHCYSCRVLATQYPKWVLKAVCQQGPVLLESPGRICSFFLPAFSVPWLLAPSLELCFRWLLFSFCLLFCCCFCAFPL